MKIVTFHTLINNRPSSALSALLDGLSEASERPDCVVVAEFTPLVREGKLLLGISACTIQKLLNVHLPVEAIVGYDYDFENLWQAYNALSQDKQITPDDYAAFDEAIECAAGGQIEELFRYCGQTYLDYYPQPDWNMYYRGWEREVVKVRRYAEMLHAMGL